MYNEKRIPGYRGMTLTEILIAVAIVGLVAGPIYMLYSSSKRNLQASSELSSAVSFASSYMTRLVNVPIRDLRNIQPMVKDTGLAPPLSLDILGVSPVREGYERYLELRKVDLDGQQFFHATVRVKWTPRGSSITQDYCQDTLLDGGANR